MRIGITYDLKQASCPGPEWTPRSASGHRLAERDDHYPDDLFEEFDSPATIEAIASVLRSLGHEVVKLGDGRELLQRLLADPPDFVFNIAEGYGIARSRESRVPAVLEMLGIPYTGSDPLTLAVTLDKDCAKRLVAAEGVAVPRGRVLLANDGCVQLGGLAKADLPVAQASRLSNGAAGRRSHWGMAAEPQCLPLIVKPAWEGSSKGIRDRCLVERLDDLEGVVARLQRDYQQPILVEEYIQGDELTVGVVGNDPPEIVGIMRVLPNQPSERFVYSVEVKRDFRQQVRYEVPADIGAPALAAVEQAALAAHRALGCRDVARIDFRLRDGIPYFLEVNPLPGLNPESSDLVIMANLAGWTHAQLIERILQAALDRQTTCVR